MKSLAFPSLQQDGLTLILGSGETGLAAARWCLRHGAALRIADTRQAPAGLDTLAAEVGGELDMRLGAAALLPDTLTGVTRIVLSPGLCPFEEPLAGFLAQAREQGVQILGEIELFALALSDLAQHDYHPKVLAVTGTNGKTTVTAMARRLAESGGFNAVAAGNISPPPLTVLMEALDVGTLPEVWVLELSSFQLESTYSLRCDAAVVLNLSQDHLDWHGSMQAYAQAKARLFKQTAITIVNRDDPLVMDMVQGLDSPEVRSFGRSVPEYEGDFGLEDSDAIEWLAAVPMGEPEPVSSRRRNKEIPLRHRGASQRLMPADALRVRGRHNALNALAAMALVHTVGVRFAPMLHALRDYVGEPHRCEFLRTVNGVDFVNDSKGTNVGATVAALEGIGRPVVLIAGGLGKGQDFAPLAESVKRYAKAVVLMGEDAPLIRSALGDAALAMNEASSMDEAVREAAALAKAGDVVLLSPACASMDMFRNYGERGHRFAEAVDELARDSGEVA